MSCGICSRTQEDVRKGLLEVKDVKGKVVEDKSEKSRN